VYIVYDHRGESYTGNTIEKKDLISFMKYKRYNICIGNPNIERKVYFDRENLCLAQRE
jgi:hypothetical protein